MNSARIREHDAVIVLDCQSQVAHLKSSEKLQPNARLLEQANNWDDQKTVSTESVFAGVLSAQPVIASPSSCGTISDCSQDILLANAGQRNVSAKASQADVPETAKSNGLKTTTMAPPQSEAG